MVKENRVDHLPIFLPRISGKMSI